MQSKLIVADIDGCLTKGRGRPVDLEVFGRLRSIPERYSFLANPWILLITARPQPYMEAILQLIGPGGVGLFEWGCGFFDPQGYRVRYHPRANEEVRATISEAKTLLTERLIRSDAGFIQPGKEIAVTVYPYGPGEEAVSKLLHEVRLWLGENRKFASLKILKSRSFVYVLPDGIDKRESLLWALEDLGVSPGDCIGVGDGEDDLPFLGICGLALAPANAREEVRQIVHYCSKLEYGLGVLDCIDHCLGKKAQ